MEKSKISLGIEIIKKEAKENNTYLYGAEVKACLFFNKLNIDLIDFIKGMNKHPFSIVRGYVMLREV